MYSSTLFFSCRKLFVFVVFFCPFSVLFTFSVLKQNATAEFFINTYEAHFTVQGNKEKWKIRRWNENRKQSTCCRGTGIEKTQTRMATILQLNTLQYCSLHFLRFCGYEKLYIRCTFFFVLIVFCCIILDKRFKHFNHFPFKLNISNDGQINRSPFSNWKSFARSASG